MHKKIVDCMQLPALKREMAVTASITAQKS